MNAPLVPEGGKNLLIHGRIPGLAFLPVDGTSIGDALEVYLGLVPVLVESASDRLYNVFHNL